MNDKKAYETTGDFEQALRNLGTDHYVLRLYVTGSTPQSAQAIMTLKKLCEERLQGKYELEIIDLYQQPGLAKSEQILAAPTLIKELPLPLRRLIGNLSDLQRVLVGLDIQPAETKP